MPSARLALREEDVVRLTLEFLHNRELHISQLSLERETGVINGQYSDDVLFLRQLILDGQWDDVIEFIQPLEALQAFGMKQFRYSILKHKYIELLCIKSEAGGAMTAANQGMNSVEGAVEEVVQILSELEKLAPSKDEYSALCLLLTLPRLADHLQYRDWNPSKARVQCFRDVFPLVEKFLPGDKKSQAISAAKNDRLIQLVIKGVLYESCVGYCQAKATGSPECSQQEMTFSRLLDGSVGFSDSDLSLLSWLQSIPSETFSVPFEQKTLNVDVERLERPSLETSWTEHMLITPIKPKTFPHSVMPFTRPRSAADIMTRSLLPTLDGLTFGLNPTFARAIEGNPMSRSSFASFHLTGIKPSSGKLMTSSVDRLFENDSDVFISSNYNDFNQALPAIQETASVQSKSPEPPKQNSMINNQQLDSATSNSGGRDSPGTATSTAKSSRRDSLTDKVIIPTQSQIQQQQTTNQVQSPPQSTQMQVPKEAAFEIPTANTNRSNINKTGPMNSSDAGGNGGGGELFEKFQRQKLNRESSVNSGVLTDTLNQTDNAAKIPNIGTKPTSNGNGINNLMKLNNNSSNGSINETNGKAVNVDEIHHQNDPSRPRFVAVTTLEDVQAVRCAEFHPSGRVYSVGSNSKTFRICEYPSLSEISMLDSLREEHTTYQPTVLFKRTKHHKGSIYCMAWSPQGDLVATGSNDKTVKLMRYNEVQKQLEGKEIELTMHDGTVRDLCFLEDSTNKTSLLISGGAGDCKIYVTDCATSTPFQALSGHGGHILTLYNWGGAMFVSGSQDKTVRFWDLRTRGCVNTVTPATVPGSRQGSPVTAVCVDPSGRLLVSGHEDSSCVLYDIRGNRPIQCFKPHSSDIRSIRFSPSAYYLLTGGYDNKLVLTDLQGDLTMPLPSVVVAQHTDKVISGRWHPTDFSFLSTSADKTATLWALPPI
ncbi:WD repeat-containing protein 47 isoform X4 [Sitodiplosis mosellana]|nr:WD repeat-containing protein 47 isoform X4 [Sitodiplosis mosellana]XP_055317870.1 WD repeat-containing protein 47 isoform X4 [Sitodiplosis mosellana]